MPRLAAHILSLSLVTAAALPSAHAQFYKIHNADVGINAVSPFPTTLNTDIPQNIQKTTSTVGLLVSFREHPVSWAGIELNYGYSKYAQRFTTPRTTADIKSYNHEFTAAYIFHPHFRALQPFIGIGGGALDFEPPRNTYPPNQWRAAGLLEAGLDLPTHNPHLGFRVQGRALFYRAPNFGSSLLSSETWLANAEPSAGVYFRY